MKLINKTLLLTLGMALTLTLSACTGCSPHTWSSESSLDSMSESIVYHQVTFDANGGTFGDGTSIKVVEVADGEQVESLIATKKYCELVGWTKSGSSAKYVFSLPVTSDLYLRAKWEEEEALITKCNIPQSDFDKSNKVIQAYIDSKEIEYCSIKGQLTLSKNATMEIKDASGYKVDESSLPLTKVCNEFQIIVKSKSGHLTNTYELRIIKRYIIHVSYFVLDKITYVEDIQANDLIEINLNPTCPDGYNFLYWSLSMEEWAPVLVIDGTDDITLYARLEVIHVEVIADANGGTFSDGHQTKTFDASILRIFEAEVPTLPGSRFLGYYFEGRQITDETGRALATWSIYDKESITIVASWEQINYLDNLEFDYSEFNGFHGTWPEYIHYGEYFHIPPTDKEWHRFLGWYCGNVQLTDKTGQSLAPWSFAADIKYTITPRFEVPDFVVYYYLNDVLIHTQIQSVEDYHNNFDLWVYETDDPTFYGWSRNDVKAEYHQYSMYICTKAWEVTFADYEANLYAWTY